MNDGAINEEVTVTPLPVMGRGVRAFLQGNDTLLVEFDLKSAPKISSTGKSEVVASGSVRGLVVPGLRRPVGGSFSVFMNIPKDEQNRE